MSETVQTFYMVLADKTTLPGWGTGAPTVRHDTIDKARNEAKRLVGLNHGTKFFVLASLGHMIKSDPVTWEKHDDIPF